MNRDTAAALRSATDGRRTGAQAIGRALDVLSCFMGPELELGIADVARKISLNPSTVHRMVRALVDAGYLVQNEDTERYSLGRTAVLLGAVAQHKVGLDLVLPVVKEVAEASGESVNFGILDGDAGVLVLRVETKQPLRYEQPIGTRVHLHSSAMGKALLAFHPEGPDAIRRLGRLRRYTEYTITETTELQRDLARIRDRGYSLDEQESQLGVRCIGAPVLGRTGHALGGVAVQIPTVRMPKKELPKLAPLVVGAAQRIAQLLPAG